MEKRTSEGCRRPIFPDLPLFRALPSMLFFVFLRVVFWSVVRKPISYWMMVERMLFRGVKAAFWRAQDAFLPEFVCFKRAIKANKWSDRRLKRESIMAALTFLHVIMVINQLNAKFAAAFSMRSRISDAFRRIWKYNARFFTLHLRLLRGICGKTSCFCHDFAQNKGDCASSCVSFKVFLRHFTGKNPLLLPQICVE